MVTPSNIRVLSFMSAQQCKTYNKYLVAPSIVKKKLTSIHQTLILTSLGIFPSSTFGGGTKKTPYTKDTSGQSISTVNSSTYSKQHWSSGRKGVFQSIMYRSSVHCSAVRWSDEKLPRVARNLQLPLMSATVSNLHRHRQALISSSSSSLSNHGLQLLSLLTNVHHQHLVCFISDIIFVKRFTRPQFWASKIYAKKAEFAIKQVRDKIM